MNPRVKQLCSYIFPSVGSLFVTYLYNVIDGIFVGQGVGAAALGAVNIGVPFITFAAAIVAMFPMGGATIIAIRMGRDDNDGSPTLSFVGMCVGAVSNIFLDWLFIFPLQMGVVGAAVASGLGQFFHFWYCFPMF